MRLAWIEVRDFRNYREAALEVPGGLTVAVGPNGQGKTNLLEAAHYLCTLESPRVRSDLPLVRAGATSAYLRGEVETAGGRIMIEVEVRSSGQNRVQANRSAVRRRRDLRRRVRSVFSGPDDLHVVEGDPHERRRFMDEAVRSLWPLKEGLAPAYERVLRQRNRLLKDWEGPEDAAGLAAWDDQLVKHGVELGVARHQAVQAIEGRAAGEFHDLAGENLQVEYRPSVWGDSPEAAFRERLAARREDELIRRSTLVGPHRDDLALAVHDLAARGFASHGEAWGAAVCLRLALGGAVGAEWGEDPLTILDDPFSGLDPDRRFRLAARVGGRGQMLMAVPDESHVPPGATVWSVKDGAVAAA